MLVKLKSDQDEQGLGVIKLSVPKSEVNNIAEAVRALLILTGHTVIWQKSDGETNSARMESIRKDTPAMTLYGVRRMLGLTQKQFGKRVGLSNTIISDMERGTRPISERTAKRIGKALNIAYELFM